jgi:hypothetical protein
MLSGFSREASRVHYQDFPHCAQDPSGLALWMTPERDLALNGKTLKH